jgi:PPPDE putative peptidase domain
MTAAGSDCCSLNIKSTPEMKATILSHPTSTADEGLKAIPENVKSLMVDVEAREPSSRASNRRDLINSVADYFEQAGEVEEPITPRRTSTQNLLDKPGLREKLDDDLFESFNERYRPNCTGTTHLRSAFRDDDASYEQKQDDRYSFCSDSKHRPATSADESEYVRKPQPHEDFGENDEPGEKLSAVLRKYQYPRHTSNAWAGEQAQKTSRLFLRMTRQMRYGRRGSLPNSNRRNRIKLHIYDLISTETVMQLPWPWGCIIPIGKCFDVVNSSLHSMGTGAYHVGIDINGVEYSYGATSMPLVSGVFSCMPRRSPGYQYRTTIDFGERTLIKKSWVCTRDTTTGKSSATKYQEVQRFVDGREVIKEMATEYMGIDYDLLRKNCVTFASDACIRLGVKEHEIPTWFRNLCESGALTQDVAMQTVEPIQNIFSACEDYSDFAEKTLEDGFEVITKADGEGMKDVVMVIDALECNQYHCIDCPALGVRRTLSWTY